jgi:hypothetical protein
MHYGLLPWSGAAASVMRPVVAISASLPQSAVAWSAAGNWLGAMI